MFWLILVVIVLVVGAAALVALGGGGSLPDVEHDRLAADLPLERQLDRADVDGLRFPMAVRGYRMDEVDDVLDRLGVELSHRDLRIGELEAALAAALDSSSGGTPGTVLLAPRTGQATQTAPTARPERTEPTAPETAAEPAEPAAETAAEPAEPGEQEQS
ncbi:DivIVA domain-containing protein [Streptacidiphilus sp. P02-A3a]|uniref:DivIVA domain-containing protein n=1 Tax=Streptacidiphilus sp. P02-A3a TaxID=2704468 RepID=UPI0015FBFDFC|nr:DivIVA domain-containing protein [Streptacidiphilus sp. P02-A3a]QMU67725.1 DivIVA domain-containing protein [Streptacidiphilus sp. P02-A3a]